MMRRRRLNGRLVFSLLFPTPQAIDLDMTPWNAAQLGDLLEHIATPALLLDLDAFERNLHRMADAVEGRGIRMRPHAKSHSCPQISLRQIALGAVGICCQKLSE